jgi:hypothetical protein
MFIPKLKWHISIVFVVYIDTGCPVPNIPSKSRDLADEKNKILTKWQWFETTVLEPFIKELLIGTTSSGKSNMVWPWYRWKYVTWHEAISNSLLVILMTLLLIVQCCVKLLTVLVLFHQHYFGLDIYHYYYTKLWPINIFKFGHYVEIDMR